MCEQGYENGYSLSIDANLLEEALRIGSLQTKQNNVNQALNEFIQRRKQREVTSLFGNLPQDAGYDYKKGR